MDKADRINRKYEARKMREEQKERKQQRKEQSEIAKWDLRKKRASDRYRTLSNEALDYYCERVRRRIRRLTSVVLVALISLFILSFFLTLALVSYLFAILTVSLFLGASFLGLILIYGTECEPFRWYCLCFIEQNQRIARR